MEVNNLKMEVCVLHSAESSGGITDSFNFFSIIIFLPILSTVGMIANLLSIYIYSRPSRQSTSRYLSALSMSDFGVCLTGLLVISADSLRSYSHFVDQIWVFLLPNLIPFGTFFQMLSAYITVFAALDCYIAVSRQFKNARFQYCTVVTANKIILSTALFTAIYNVVAFGELQTVPCIHPLLNSTIYELQPTELRLNDAYITIYRGYMYAGVMAFFPFVVLVILTVGILYAMNANRSTLERLDIVDNANTEEGDDANATITLVVVVTLFLLCSSVALFVNICEMISNLMSPDLSMKMIDVGNVLVVFNATANFFIYITFSPSYRAALEKIFLRSATRHKKPFNYI